MISDNIPNQEYYQYDPWGKPLDNFTDALQPFRYAGYYYDEETGLYYLKSRYYSPMLGRFLTRDGYGFVKYRNPQTLNLYAYAENNPVSNTDPSGHFVKAGGTAALAPGEAAAIAALGTAAIGTTVELAEEVKGAWDWYWAEREAFKNKLKDIENNPENWEETGKTSEPATGLRNRGGESIEEEFTNKNTGEKLWRHTLKNRNGKVIDQHYRPYPK
jgi:RHS repeat-associated protein